MRDQASAVALLAFMKEFMIYKNPGMFWRTDIVRPGVKRGTRIGSLNDERYRVAALFGKQYREHHLVWLWHHGRWPIEIDHKNRRKACNRIDNLRECTRPKNSANAPGRRTARTSTFKGVSYGTRDKKWRATIVADEVYKSLGYFSEEIDAAKAYDEAAKRLHGEFAFLNFPEQK